MSFPEKFTGSRESAAGSDTSEVSPLRSAVLRAQLQYAIENATKEFKEFDPEEKDAE